MYPQTFDEEAIFKVACRIDDADARADYLRQVCEHDASLKTRVEQLLSVYLQDPDYLEGPHPTAVAGVDWSDVPQEIGSNIGPYTLRERIGEGGMGEVYVAEQTEGVRRTVALKVIKSGMATKDVLARFEAERQALAMMDHSNIARILDGGAMESGQPYFVMELVQGLPITEYCDAKQLDTRQRLEVFTTVCSAVHHAHQKGIIHGDLKPSNVLVSEIDGAAAPKVIDFGIAKAINQKPAEQTLQTNFSQMVGTPLYMSPEQADSDQDVDTRSDIYSLGVLLYELLVGTTPIDTTSLQSGDYRELRRVVRTEVRPKPSERFVRLGANTVEAARNRRESTTSLLKKLQRELDWVVMKAIEIDRACRYDTAREFASDVQRYLDHEPVLAHPPTPTYRLGKLIQRRQGMFAAIASIMAVTLLGLVLSTAGFLSATRHKSELAIRLYASNMMSSYSAWDAGDIETVSELLEEYQPTGANEDLRGFEWFHLLARYRQVSRVTAMRHVTEIQAIAFGQDYVLAAGLDQRISRFDLVTGERRIVDVGHKDRVTCLQLSKNGATLASGSWDGSVRWWNPATPGIVHSRDIGERIRAVAVSPAGDTLALGTATGRIEVWGISETSSQRKWSAVHSEGWLLAIALSPDGNFVASSGADSTVKVWHASTGQLLATISSSRSWIWAIAFSPDGTSLATGGWDDSVKLWDVADSSTITLRMPLSGGTRFVRSLAFSADGRTLAAAGHERLVSRWDVATGELISEERGHTSLVTSLAFSPDRNTLASGSVDRTVRLANVTMERSDKSRTSAEFVSLEPVDSDDFAVALGGGGLGVTGKLGFCNWSDGKSRVTSRPGIITCSATVPAGRKGGQLILGIAHQDELGQWFTEIGFSNEGQESTPIVAKHPGRVFCIDVSPDGQTLATGTGEGKVQLWSMTSGERLRPLTGHARWVQTLAFSPDGSLVVSGGGAPDVSGSIVISRVATGEIIKEFDDFTEQVMDVVFLPDRHSFAAASGDGTLRIYDTNNKFACHIIDRDTFMITSLALSPDGRTLAAGSPSGIVKLWHMVTRTRVGTLQSSPGLARLAFTPNGDALVVASSDGSVTTWYAPRADAATDRQAVSEFSLVDIEPE